VRGREQTDPLSQTLVAKDFKNLQPLTSGAFGYSLLRPEINSAYFHELFDSCEAFGIPIEGELSLVYSRVRLAS
jgi:hypothetical protein